MSNDNLSETQITPPPLENPRIALYKEAIVLEEQRVNLQAQLDQVLFKIASLRDQLFESSSVFSKNSYGGAPVQSARRGELKVQILRALVAAGQEGVRVQNLSATLGVRAANIHSWFQGGVKRYPQIKRIGEAHYRLEGEIPAADLQAPVIKVPFRRRSGYENRNTRPLSRRGELMARILTALKEAGSEGLLIRDIAQKVGSSPRNMFIWFATTGKKNPKIEKIGEARYRFNE